MKHRRLRRVGVAILVAAIVLAWLLVSYAPAVPHSVLGGVALVVVGGPALIALEALGDWLFDRPFFARRSRAGRIALAVPAVLLCLPIGWGVLAGVRWLVVHL